MSNNRNISLTDYNSFRTSAFAKFFCEPQSITEIKSCLQLHAAEDKLIIGGGCNLFFTKDFEGLVVHPLLKGVAKLSETADWVDVEAMAGENWDDFVKQCVDAGYAGLENLSLIPGTVGAAPVQNIGAYGAEAKDCILEVKTLNMSDLGLRSFSNEECRFDYRESFFKYNREFLITSVVFRLYKNFNYQPRYKELNEELSMFPSPTLQQVRDAVITIRRRKLPDERELPNAGSFFKNPYISKEKVEELSGNYPNLPVFPTADGNSYKTSAAFLIDKAGFKGVRDGNVGTYSKQPLIIVNYGTPNGKNIVAFMHKIQENVERLFGIKLEPEVRIL
ncbi:MAG: UDP-N-acetylmuramate dehydrogenase [Culturomica sp.]|nr:UDP-N-acetylmuramate dehydrogenase [Culturomica sp.]